MPGIAAKLGIGSYRRLPLHGSRLRFPRDRSGAWDALKQALKERGLMSGPKRCYRTNVGCLRVCRQGPTMLVYPEGTWYHGMTAVRIPTFVEEYLVQDRPVSEWVFAENPLGKD